MPLDVGPPRTPRFGSPVVLSRAHWVRRSRVLAFGRTKVAASSEAGRPKAESSIRLVAMRKPVGAWFRAKARGLFPSIGPAGIAKLSRRCYRRRGEQKRNTKLQPIDGRRHLHSLNPERRSAVEYGIGGNDEPPPALLIAAGAGTGKTKALAHRVRLSRFVIADITDPKSVPAELQTTVPQFMVPFLPIIEGKKGGKKNQKPYSLLESLWIECKERVFEPLWYSSLDALVEAFDEKIIKRAEVRFAELLARKAEKMKGEYV